MSNIEQNKFLGKLYDMLLREDIINEKDKPKDLKTKIERLQKYLDKIKRVQDKAADNDRYLNMIKELYYDRYIIKPEDIPESYLRSLEKQYLDNGHGHINLVEPKTEEDEILKEEHINNIIRVQKESLDNWLNYLLSPDSSYLDMWAKVWAFQGMLGIGNLNEEKNGYKKRSNVTINPFISMDSEILGKCVDLLKETLNKKEVNDNELEKIIKSGNFSKLYGMLFANKKLIKTNGTEGIWIKYNYETEESVETKEKQGVEPEYIKLYNSLQGYNTGWCTAGSKELAKSQICSSSRSIGGDFYVYYSIDQNGEYKIPRIAIRMEQNKIGEIRGIAENQNIESDMEQILEEKLKEFPDADRYKKNVSHMKKLTDIYYKSKDGIELSREELIFIYEREEKIIGFGYERDPRIDEITNSRNKRKDFALIFNCKENEIGTSKKDLKRNLIYYSGDINVNNLDSFKKLLLLQKVFSMGKNKSFVMPVNMEGNITYNLKSAKSIILPQILKGNLDLSKLQNANGLNLPKHIIGSLFLDDLKNTTGLTFPLVVDKDVSLGSLEHGRGAVLPEIVGDDLDLSSLKYGEWIQLPKKIGGNLYLNKLKRLADVVLPEYVGKNIYYYDISWTLDKLKQQQQKELNYMFKTRKMGFVNNTIIIGCTLLISLLSIFIAILIIK